MGRFKNVGDGGSSLLCTHQGYVLGRLGTTLGHLHARFTQLNTFLCTRWKSLEHSYSLVWIQGERIVFSTELCWVYISHFSNRKCVAGSRVQEKKSWIPLSENILYLKWLRSIDYKFCSAVGCTLNIFKYWMWQVHILPKQRETQYVNAENLLTLV